MTTSLSLRHRVATLVVSVSAVLMCGQVPARAQTSADDRAVSIVVEASNAPIRRSNGLFAAAGAAVNAAADLGLDAAFGPAASRKASGRVARLARLWVVNLPIAALAEGFAHNYGHFARLDEHGVHTRQETITSWPWPFPLAGSVESFGEQAFERLPRETQLGIFGGGEQAATAQKSAMTDAIYSADATDYFQWVQLGYAALDYPVYGLADLQRSNFSSFAAFSSSLPGDFRDYAATLANLDPAGPTLAVLQANGNILRRNAWINLADGALAAAFVRAAEYVWTGTRRAGNPALHFGPFRLIAGGRATLTTLGPEAGGDVRVITRSYLTHLQFGAITTAARQHLWTEGIDLRGRDPSRLLPEGRLDVWQQPNGGTGWRVELGARHTLPWADGRADAAVRIGYKTAGYVDDAPERAGGLVTVTATIRVR